MTDERLISVFLTCRFPEKYTFYKSNVYNYLCEMAGVEKKKPEEKLEHYYELLNTVFIPLVEKETELISKINVELDSKGLIHSTPLIAQTILWYAMTCDKYLIQGDSKVYGTYFGNGVDELNNLEKRN